MQKRLLIFTFLLIIALAATSCAACRQRHGATVSPLDFGLRKARTGVERYGALYKAHSVALAQGKTVDYSRIKKVEIEIPNGANSIPLTVNTDFKGATITVVNNSKDLFLFEYKGTTAPISVMPQEVDTKRYSTQPLQKGLFLLIVKDKNPWVRIREGHTYGAIRKDIVLIEDGVGKDGPCSPYNNKYSSPVFSYREVTATEKSFTNLTFVRKPGCKNRTKLVKFSNEINIRIAGISITTPPGTLIGDQAICVNDCANVLIEDVTIDGTYSTAEKYGYGFSMDNCWNVTLRNITASAPWGVFGSNNLHQVKLENCNVNRFDIHCYGKDVKCLNCTFNNTGGQYSSVFGTIQYENCTFNDASPYTNRPDYNAYVGFDLVINNCVWNPTRKKYFLVNLQQWSDKVNEREELKQKCLPNIRISNLTVHVPEGCTTIDVLHLPRTLTYPKPAGYISEIKIDGVEFRYAQFQQTPKLRLSSGEIRTEQDLDCRLNALQLKPVMRGAATINSQETEGYGNVEVNFRNRNGGKITITNR